MKCFLLVVLSDTSLFTAESGVLKFDYLCGISNMVTVSNGISFQCGDCEQWHLIQMW